MQCWTARVCLSIYDMVRRCGAVVTRHIVRVNNNTRKLIGGLISSHRALVTTEHEMDSSSTGAPPTQRLHLNESNSSTYFCEIALASGNESKHASVDLVVFWCLLNCSRFGISSDKWLYFLSIVICFVDEMEDYKRFIKPVAVRKYQLRLALSKEMHSGCLWRSCCALHDIGYLVMNRKSWPYDDEVECRHDLSLPYN